MRENVGLHFEPPCGGGVRLMCSKLPISFYFFDLVSIMYMLEGYIMYYYYYYSGWRLISSAFYCFLLLLLLEAPFIFIIIIA